MNELDSIDGYNKTFQQVFELINSDEFKSVSTADMIKYINHCLYFKQIDHKETMQLKIQEFSKKVALALTVYIIVVLIIFLIKPRLGINNLIKNILEFLISLKDTVYDYLAELFTKAPDQVNKDN